MSIRWGEARLQAVPGWYKDILYHHIVRVSQLGPASGFNRHPFHLPEPPSGVWRLITEQKHVYAHAPVRPLSVFEF